MNKEELFLYMETHLDDLYNNFSIVFGLEKNSVYMLLTNLIKAFEYNDKLSEKEYDSSIFSVNALINLRTALQRMGINDDLIRKIIVKTPNIILYSNKLEYIYYLFKNNKYYGLTLLDDKYYNTYLLNEHLNSNIVSNNYITKEILNYYKLSGKDKEEFDQLESENKLKNYYYKQKKQI